jgi:ABC-type transport system involved in cytochrome bd biosynthesis fused ATPase/permease subunit
MPPPDTVYSFLPLPLPWPGGQRVFDGLNVVVGPGRTGLIGANGSGKFTLLRLVPGELKPKRGSVTVAGTLGYLPQNITLRERLRVEEILDIARTRAALVAIESGDTDAEHFTAVCDDWDVEERARAMLDQFGLSGLTLDRRVGELSGGEAVLLELAGGHHRGALSRRGASLWRQPHRVRGGGSGRAGGGQQAVRAAESVNPLESWSPAMRLQGRGVVP